MCPERGGDITLFSSCCNMSAFCEEELNGKRTNMKLIRVM